MDQKARDLISKYLSDLRALESHGLQAVSQQVIELKNTNHPVALRTCEDFHRTLQAHVNDLDVQLKALGGSRTAGVGEALTAAIDTIAGIYNAFRSEKASKALRDDYTFFSLDAMSNLMLHTTSLSLGDVDTASVVERGYRDCARMIMEIDRIMPELVLDELRGDGFAPASIAAECHKLISSGWTRGSTRTATRQAP